MELDKLSKDALVSILTSVIEKGGITSEDMIKLVKDNPPKDICREADFLHTNLCEESHQEGGCEYYKEESSTGTAPVWARPFHQKWLGMVIFYRAKYPLYNLAEIVFALRAIGEAFNKCSTNGTKLLLYNILEVAGRSFLRNVATELPPTETL